MTSPSHVPVLLDRVVALLAPALDHEGAVLVDATLGLGGHTEAVLESCALARVIGIDRDPQALTMAGERLAAFGARFTGVHAVYDEIPDVLHDLGLTAVDAVLFDLGVSSLQLDVVDRGFTYREDSPLDMRMDGTGSPGSPGSSGSSGSSGGLTAADILNTYPVADLTRVLREYGEEKFARQIARAVVRARETAPFVTSARLVDLLYDVIPAPARRTGGHPAKRTFQALRMEVNDELAVLRRALPAAIDAIAVGGRVVVESYHSLEDRVVKRAFADAVSTDVPDDLPFIPEGHEPAYRLVTRGAERADDAEVEHNPRAASVRLRAIERLAPSPSRGVAPEMTRR
jgi:16S rRNA (cytosine1402-N4)-methyltransferase